MKKLIIALFVPLLLSLPAHALVELRAGYGLITPSDDGTLGGTSSINTVAGFNLDALVELPMIPLGFGLRYEMMEFAVGSIGTVEAETELTRLSLLVNYRIIDMFVYLGVIGSVGFSNSAEMENVPLIPGPGTYTQKFEKDLDFTVGVEGGVSLGLFMVGAELGYYSGGDWDEIEGNQITTGNLNLDGIYAKALVGVGF